MKTKHKLALILFGLILAACTTAAPPADIVLNGSGTSWTITFTDNQEVNFTLFEGSDNMIYSIVVDPQISIDSGSYPTGPDVPEALPPNWVTVSEVDESTWLLCVGVGNGDTKVTIQVNDLVVEDASFTCLGVVNGEEMLPDQETS